jgi:hypothetical protein
MERNLKELYNDSKEASRLYVDNEIETFKLRLARKLITYISGAASFIILAVFLGIGFGFAALGITLGWGHYLGNYALAFFYMAGIFLLFGLILFLFKSRLITSQVVKSVMKEMFDND